MFQETGVEPNVKCEILDMPAMYHFQDETFDRFHDALADSTNYELFQSKAVQKIIDFNFPIVKKYTIRKLFMPFAAFLFLFVFYNNFVYVQRSNPDPTA